MLPSSLPNPILSLLQAKASPESSIRCIRSDSSEASPVTRIPEQVIYQEYTQEKLAREWEKKDRGEEKPNKGSSPSSILWGALEC